MNQAIDILSRITERYGVLRGAERKVAALIIDDIDFVSGASISEIAIRAAVSQASVTRFARTIGCDNVRDLKLKLAQSLAVGRRFIQEASEEDGLGAVYDIAKQTLDLNRELLEAADIDGAVELLDGARQILIFGAGGGSTALGYELQFRLVRLGYAVSAYPWSLMPRMVASTLAPDDVVVVLSVTGYTPEIIDAARIARSYDARVVALTATGSPLTRQADVVLPIAARETDFIYHPSSSRYAMLAAIDVLAMTLALRHRQTARDRLRRLKLTLDDYRGGDNYQPLGD